MQLATGKWYILCNGDRVQCTKLLPTGDYFLEGHTREGYTSAWYNPAGLLLGYESVSDYELHVSTPLSQYKEKTEMVQVVEMPVDAGGKKYDTGKPRMDLLPAAALEEIAKVLAFGAQKYDSWNWARGIAYSRLAGAALRHLFARMRGEVNDPESGLPHLAHVGCCVLFLIWMEKHRPDLNDFYSDPGVTV